MDGSNTQQQRTPRVDPAYALRLHQPPLFTLARTAAVVELPHSPGVLLQMTSINKNRSHKTHWHWTRVVPHGTQPASRRALVYMELWTPLMAAQTSDDTLQHFWWRGLPYRTTTMPPISQSMGRWCGALWKTRTVRQAHPYVIKMLPCTCPTLKQFLLGCKPTSRSGLILEPSVVMSTNNSQA